ncbi:MAG: DUF927 domain-containing protein, partial [Polyangiaceae bacterium]|nr:DUF927 domain-containing protein [Polyangiaceae bacterium]
MSRQDAGSSTTPCGPSSGESQRIGDVESDSPYQTTPKKPTITADGQVVGFELPKDFSIRHVDGRYSLVRSYCPRKGQEMWNRVVCRSLIWVDAELEAENQGEFLLRICFRDGANESGVSDVVVPCSYLDSKQKLAKSLIGAGVRLLPENCAKADMAEYLSGLQVMNQHLIPRGNACSQFGWNEHKTGFLLGRVRIGEDADYFWSKNTKDHNRADQLRTQGSPEQWRGIAEAMIAEAPVAALAL